MAAKLLLLVIIVLTPQIAFPDEGGDFDNALARMDSLMRELHYDSAIASGQIILRDAESAFGTEDTIVARALDRLARCYRSKSMIAKADSLWSRSLAIQESKLGPSHLDVLNTHLNLSSNKMLLGRIDEAEKILNLAISNIVPDSDTLKTIYMHCLSGLGQVAWESNRPDEAERYCRRALALCDSTFGPDHRYSASNLTLLANIYSQGLRVVEADDLFKRALTILENDPASDEKALMPCLYFYANFLAERGHRYKAVEYYERCLNSIETIYGQEHPYMIACLVHLAGSYFSLHEFEKSRAYNLRALSFCRERYGEDHPYVWGILINLASSESRLGRFEEADSLWREGLRLKERLYGQDHPLMYATLESLAETKYALGQIEASRKLARRALGLVSSRFTADHDDIEKGLSNLLLKCRDVVGTSVSDVQIISILNRMGSFTTVYDLNRFVNTLWSLSTACRIVGMHEEAAGFGEYAYRAALKSFQVDAIMQSDQQKSERFLFVDYAMGNCLGAYGDDPAGFQNHRKNITELVFTHKRLIANALLHQDSWTTAAKNPVVKSLTDSLMYARMRLSSMFVGAADSLDNLQPGTDTLLKLIGALESEIARQGYGAIGRETFSWADFDSIRSCLPPDASIVEFLRYSYQRISPSSSYGGYLAIVVNENQDPAVIELGSADEIETIIEEYLSHMNRIGGRGGIVTEDDAREYAGIANELYRKIWSPIEPHIRGKRLALISPDAYLHALSFSALPDDSGVYLIEKMAVHYIPSGGSVPDILRPHETGSGLLAIGAPAFDATITAATLRSVTGIDTTGTGAGGEDAGLQWVCEGLSDICLQPIPGAEEEIELISSKWQSLSDEAVTAFIGDDATEFKFKNEATGKRAIHLATHGYFLDCDYDAIASRDSVNDWLYYVPSLLSGLFWAEVNDLEHGGLSGNFEDGVLTAYEVSALNLKGTELVILSACESGKGHFFSGHEASGLTWAFRKAGARTVVSCLWPVLDTSVPEIFGRLYDRKKPNLARTLRSIQLDLIDKARAENRPDHPVNWGAFLSVGDWR